ncbi:DcrB-related protein [Clostridium sp. KNHs214]|uniref:DcrB-related protein n=1 Tax=Clostridium sp. KNHs214 TaxID=1540257 RepID=UPI0005501DE1|nr:DcrB-related protein [Clostridium sp. KNHs214]
MKKIILKFLCCTLLLSSSLCLLVGCNKSTKQSNTTTKKAEASKKIKSKDNICQVTVPDSWKTATNLNDVANIQVANMSKEKYLITISESKDNFSDSMTLDEYTKIVSQNLSKSVVNSKLSSVKDLTINGQKAKQLELTGEVNKVKAGYIITVVQTKKNFHQIITWTMGKYFDEYKDDYHKIINTFKEL